MNSDTDRYLLELFRQSGDWSDAELDTLDYVYHRHVKDGEDLLRLLIRVKVFQRTSVQVVEMMRAGQLKPSHLSFLFQSSGSKLLRNSLRVEEERRQARESQSEEEQSIEAELSGRMAQPVMPTATPTGSMTSNRLMNPSVDYQVNRPMSLSSTTMTLTNQSFLLDRKPRVGMVLGKCLLTGLLGQGGSGKVFSGLHQTLNIQVAIKVLISDETELSPEQIARLAREAQLLARLNHPNVIRVLDYDDMPLPYVTMEYIEGLSLADLIEQTGGLRVPRTAEIMIQVASGLAAAWEVGLVHRDVKPGNILLTKAGVAKVTDLGLAYKIGSDTDPPIAGESRASHSPLGTCGYISPEQAVNDPSIDFRTDVYSLGATFYHAVTGRMPFVSKSTRQLLMMHMTQPVTPPHLVAPGVVDTEVSAVICRMMEKNPNDRYSSYEELIQDLIPLAQGPAVANGTVSTPGSLSQTPAQFRHTTFR
ncbi:MAG: serine/threonine-protein kinase [Gemmataceae bacterium]